MKLLPIFGITALLFLPSVGWAADEPPKPVPPYVAEPPKNGHWKISVQWIDPSAVATPGAPATPPLPPSPTKINALEILKVGDFRRALLTYGSRPPVTVDQRGIYVFTIDDDGQWASYAANAFMTPYAFFSVKFPLTEWVGIDSYKDLVKYKGVQTFHYKSGDLEAWIAIDTMLPVGAKRPDAEITFEFLTPPTGPLPLDPQEAVLLRRIDHPPLPSP